MVGGSHSTPPRRLRRKIRVSGRRRRRSIGKGSARRTRKIRVSGRRRRRRYGKGIAKLRRKR